MNQFVSNINSPSVPNTVTTNGMPAYTTTGAAAVDLFYNIGASRNDPQGAVRKFVAAFVEDRLIASKILFWARDIRGGAGEREVFRKCLNWLSINHVDIVRENLDLIPEFGRFDDFESIEVGTKARKEAMEFWAIAIRNGNGLAAKWAPRKGSVANELRQTLGLTPRLYRKMIVAGSNTVEQLMCAKDWDKIEFDKLPSVASARYQKAFGRNAFEKYSKYVEALKKGEVKVNASAVYPYDVIKSIKFGGNVDVANAQWEALPNYMGDQKVLAMVDVSGSMSCPAGKGMNVTCLEVALSLGLYTADKLQGAYKDTFLTFSSSPELLHVKGNLSDKLVQMCRSKWEMSTNITAAFTKVLDHAKANKVPFEDMPTTVIIFSDMQFDQCAKFNVSAMEMVKAHYAASQYVVPRIVFWNLNASGNAPVKFNEAGVALVSGFSPAIMQSLLKAENFDPYSIMLKTINSDRYARVVV